MTNDEYAVNIIDACDKGATISAIKCFIESIRRDERLAIIELASKQGWGMRNEDPFEDAVRDICDMRSNA